VVELTGGEPTLHPDFLTIVKHCAEIFPLVSIITNGYVLNEDHIEKLSKYIVCDIKNLALTVFSNTVLIFLF
jgi:MoaA/NifB/PqqE/SkfB family radical SAM enzyme